MLHRKVHAFKLKGHRFSPSSAMSALENLGQIAQVHSAISSYQDKMFET